MSRNGRLMAYTCVMPTFHVIHMWVGGCLDSLSRHPQQYGDLTLQETVQLHPQQQQQGFDDLLWDGKTFMFH